ncbi:hypothetical protein lerEdw1_000399 [Lerista edwardsae]|nr:hypothetical protein lerEdw1_000399 [Lerista edwardsae]
MEGVAPRMYRRPNILLQTRATGPNCLEAYYRPMLLPRFSFENLPAGTLSAPESLPSPGNVPDALRKLSLVFIPGFWGKENVSNI